MKLTIFDVYVPLKSKQQLNRLLNDCECVGLEVNKDNAFKKGDYFRKGICYGFGNWFSSREHTQVTEAEFLTLLNEYKKTLE